MGTFLYFRHNDLEVDLTNVRLEMSKLDMQLMEAIQQKVAMSVQVDAWEVNFHTFHSLAGRWCPRRRIQTYFTRDVEPPKPLFRF